MGGETIDFIEVERLDEAAIDLLDSRIDSGEFESIHRDRWISSGEAKHRLRMDQSAFVRAISTLVDEHEIPQSKLRRGKARNTEYSEITISLIEALESGDDEALERLKAVVFSCGRTEEVNVVAPIKFKQSADAQMAISDSQIIHLGACSRTQAYPTPAALYAVARDGKCREDSPTKRPGGAASSMGFRVP
jgi:hypothetical protein